MVPGSTLRSTARLDGSTFFRARSALAAAAESEGRVRKKLLREAERATNHLDRHHTHYSGGQVALLRASVASVRGRNEETAELLASAELGFERAEAALMAAVIRRRRGELLGGEEGKELVDAADRWMAGQEIKNPPRMSAMLAPGSWS